MPRVRVVKKKRRLLNSLRGISHRFTKQEVGHILIAWIVLSFAFTFAFDSGIYSIGFALAFCASAVVLGCGFIMHELMHKFTAQKYRYHATFIMWPWGILLALVTSLFGMIFAAPGATYFEPDPREQYLDPNGFTKRYGIISLAGPKINIIFGFIFFGLFLLSINLLAHSAGYIAVFILLVTGFGSYINFYLAAFNMLPINPLDGYKVFNWSRRIWFTVFALAVGMTIINFIYVYPTIIYILLRVLPSI